MIKTYHERILIVDGKNYFPLKDVLIFDIETDHKDNSKISAENCGFKIWGAYSYKTGTASYGYEGNHAKELQDLINNHRIIVGHNIKDFDIPILERDLGISFRGKIPFDILEVLRKPPSKLEKEAYLKKGKRAPTGKGRSLIIGEALQKGMKDNRFPDFKLSTIAKHGHKLFGEHPLYSKFFKEYKDDDFDYNVLNKEVITEEDWVYIINYLRQDLIVTKNIFEFLERYFEGMSDGLSPKSIEDLGYVHYPTGSYFYNSICYALNLPLEYGDNTSDKFIGAYVKLPEKEKYEGDGFCVDWSSFHPHNIWSANLATPINKCKHKVNGKCPNPYNGDGKIFKLKGIYCGCEIGEIEKWIRYKFFKRNEYRRKFIRSNGSEIKYKDITKEDNIYYVDENKDLSVKKLTDKEILEVKLLYDLGVDPREYSIKILINSGYGVLASPIFKSTYNETTGADTTLMSVQANKFIAKWFEDHGYIVTYMDTDSCYIIDIFKDKNKFIKIMAEGVQQVRDALPFSDNTYNMDIDADFSHIFFFQDKDSADKHYKKKNYIYITKENEVKLNGIPLLKINAPLLAKNIYNNYLEKEIIRTKNIKFDKGYLRQLIEFEISKDKSVLLSKIRVSPAASYASEGQLQAQISAKYFDGKAGIFQGFKHTRKGYGVGKGKFYCSLDESKSLGIHEYDLETVWKVLDPFVKEDKQLGLGDF